MEFAAPGTPPDRLPLEGGVHRSSRARLSHTDIFSAITPRDAQAAPPDRHAPYETQAAWWTRGGTRCAGRCRTVLPASCGMPSSRPSRPSS
eukprot:7391012-Prymnesium_polylepis.2